MVTAYVWGGDYFMRTASQILAKHCPTPHPIRVDDEDFGEYEYYVPMKDAIAAIKEAAGQEKPDRDLTVMQCVGAVAWTLLSSPFIVIIAGITAVIDNVELTIARVKPSDGSAVAENKTSSN